MKIDETVTSPAIKETAERLIKEIDQCGGRENLIKELQEDFEGVIESLTSSVILFINEFTEQEVTAVIYGYYNDKKGKPKLSIVPSCDDGETKH